MKKSETLIRKKKKMSRTCYVFIFTVSFVVVFFSLSLSAPLCSWRWASSFVSLNKFIVLSVWLNFISLISFFFSLLSLYSSASEFLPQLFQHRLPLNRLPHKRPHNTITAASARKSLFHLLRHLLPHKLAAIFSRSLPPARKPICFKHQRLLQVPLRLRT